MYYVVNIENYEMCMINAHSSSGKTQRRLCFVRRKNSDNTWYQKLLAFDKPGVYHFGVEGVDKRPRNAEIIKKISGAGKSFVEFWRWNGAIFADVNAVSKESVRTRNQDSFWDIFEEDIHATKEEAGRYYLFLIPESQFDIEFNVGTIKRPRWKKLSELIAFEAN